MEKERIPNDQLRNILLDFEAKAYAANNEGCIFQFLGEHSIPYQSYDRYDFNPLEARILIVGDSMIKESEIRKVLKQLGIDNSRVDVVLGYREFKTSKWKNIRYSNKYSDVIFGPIPHSVEGKGDYSSIITKMEKEKDGWPNVVCAMANDKLKITNRSLIGALSSTIFYQKLVCGK